MDYVGVIIDESLRDRRALREVRIRRTAVHPVTARHRTPWVRQWTMHVVEVPEEGAETVAKLLADTLDASHGAWYADFKNTQTHYVVYPGRVFRVRRGPAGSYHEAKAYGRDLGIPEYQLDFDTYDVEQV
jgi:hypothetical protein